METKNYIKIKCTLVGDSIGALNEFEVIFRGSGEPVWEDDLKQCQ